MTLYEIIGIIGIVIIAIGLINLAINSGISLIQKKDS